MTNKPTRDHLSMVSMPYPHESAFRVIGYKYEASYPTARENFPLIHEFPDDPLIAKRVMDLLGPKAVKAILEGKAVVMPAAIGRDKFAQAAYHKPHGGGFYVNIDDTRLDKPTDAA